MRTLLHTLFFGILISGNTYAQTYTHPTTGINSEYVGACLVADCGPLNYYDNGGPSGNYSSSINNIYRVFCPSIAGNCMKVTFSSFNTEYNYDWLNVGNGPTQNSPWFTSAPTISGGYLTGNLGTSVPFSFTSTDASGCLTFRFRSDGSVTRAGWSAVLSCVPCAGGPNGTDNSDCITKTPLCGTYSLSGQSSGPGIIAEGCTGSACPAGGENHTNWYVIKAQTSGTINLTITPTTSTDDYDFAVYGPNVTCGALGSPLRCTDSGLTGTTGTSSTAGDNTETVLGDSYVNTINANAGDEFYIVVDKWSPASGAGGYTMNFSGTASLDCSVLPVELSEFNVEYAPEMGVVDLIWKTATEHNNDFWEVERSTDGENWEVINQVKGAGTTEYETQYYAVDPNPFAGVNYYRVTQWDFNGSGRSSEVRTVNILDDFYDMISLFPNPTNGSTEVIFNSYTVEQVMLNVTDAEGKVVVNMPIDAQKGGNRFDLDMSAQQRGLYIITITTRDKVYKTKLLKD